MSGWTQRTTKVLNNVNALKIFIKNRVQTVEKWRKQRALENWVGKNCGYACTVGIFSKKTKPATSAHKSKTQTSQTIIISHINKLAHFHWMFDGSFSNFHNHFVIVVAFFFNAFFSFMPLEHLCGTPPFFFACLFVFIIICHIVKYTLFNLLNIINNKVNTQRSVFLFFLFFISLSLSVFRLFFYNKLFIYVNFKCRAAYSIIFLTLYIARISIPIPIAWWCSTLCFLLGTSPNWTCICVCVIHANEIDVCIWECCVYASVRYARRVCIIVCFLWVIQFQWATIVGWYKWQWHRQKIAKCVFKRGTNILTDTRHKEKMNNVRRLKKWNWRISFCQTWLKQSIRITKNKREFIASKARTNTQCYIQWICLYKYI